MTTLSTSPMWEGQPEELAQELRQFIDRSVQRAGGDTKPIRPGHRVKFHWPPHPISYSFHVLAHEWGDEVDWNIHGENLRVKVARTPYGVFGRCEEIWHEDRGDTLEEMLSNLAKSSEPFFQRQLLIADTIEQQERYRGAISELSPSSLLKLLYCTDRDVSHDALATIERHASQRIYLPALLEILRDKRHPFRRSAQWCVLDLFEALPSFCEDEAQERQAVEAIRDLIWSAEDDYARTIYKAGVVLGGHIPYGSGGPALIDCLRSPSKVGRRSAIHGCFHVVEWVPQLKERVVTSLRQVAQTDEEPLLQEFAAAMARDIDKGDTDHIAEPLFPEEK